MKSDSTLDYAEFQLSPKHSRCELFVSSGGSTEKLASGLLKPFVAHLQIAEERVASASLSVKLEVGKNKNAETWFTKGTLERFVRFVSTPEVLELVSTLDAEMSQLEAARRIYSQGAGDQLSGGGGSGATAADDATKKELLRAIDVRLVAVRQDLSTACARAAAAGFNADTVSELQMFADRFGAHRLNEACSKFISLSERGPELIHPRKSGHEDRAVRSSYGSDMSIDDDPTSPPPDPETATYQQPNPPPVTFPLRRTFSRESSVDREDGNKTNDTVPEKDRKDESSSPDQSVPISASQPARRLSVQDRISMFENKQKDTSGGKPVVVKAVELRRMSSDLSSSSTVVEKGVLRRWSGASDMSIDLSAEKKDTESPSCTPTSAVVSQDKKVLRLNDDNAEISSVSKPEIKVIPGLVRGSDSRLKGISFNNSEQYFESTKSNSNLGLGESDGLEDAVRGKSRSSPSISGGEDQESPKENFKTLTGGKKSGSVGFGNQGRSTGEELIGLGSQKKITGGNDPTQIRPFLRKGDEQLEIPNQKEDSEPKNESVKKIPLKASQRSAVELGVLEGGPGSRIRKAFASRYKGIEGDSPSVQPEARSVGEAEVAQKKESYSSEKVSSTSVSSVEARAAGETEFAGEKGSRTIEKVSSTSISSFEDSVPRSLKFNKRGLSTELSKKARVQRDEHSSSGNISRTQFSGKVIIETQEGSDSFSTPPPEQAQRIRQSKGNQELNDELKVKASELEKLFAEHKSRGPGDQSNPARKGRSGDTQPELSSSLYYTKPVADISSQLANSYQPTEPITFSKTPTKFDVGSPVKTIDSQYYGDAINKFSELSVSEGSRGEFYNSYMQKRDAKLREDWISNRAEKEARLKSMQDSLERNRSEMKAKISGSADRQDSVSSAHRRAERLRSYNSRSFMKREQQHLDFGDSENDEEASEFSEQNHLRESRALDETSFRDGVSRGTQGKKHLPSNKNLASSTPRTSSAPVPKSASKIPTINSGKRRMQPENPLGQSVPNFSDLRKENTKPSSGAGRTTRSQIRNYSRSNSTSNEAAFVREDKSRLSQSLRKSSANPSEFGEMYPLDSDGVVLTPTKFDEEIQKNVVTKPFLKKGSRNSFIARTSAREKASVGSEFIKNEEENSNMETEPDEFTSTGKDEGVEEFETFNTDMETDFDNGHPREGMESEKNVNSESENGDGTLTFSLVDQALGSHLPIESVQDWPEESPVSWNSHTQHPFSYAHEMSDVDASVDSPVGSPASWNSHSLNQIEIDAARMRKKWGTAQKPMVAHSSNNLSRKDRTTGFKRLLKFGRKSRGSESLVDWISATTSEGDDDTEDGRDPANRSSEDLRKSRMGFSHAQPSYDNFNESEFFNESVQSSQNSILVPPDNFKLREDHMSGSSIKAPRSFFSLSSFRSKGSSDTRPR
ncbi:hypothetical protein ABFS82_04G091600 [Erythranthe guttata]|uniref:COP1-interacting protein 7 n=1 Tax=Erythranthe guttata TaxID=4155 RepID=A0A022S0Q3_ERYGU|nr:PREDICTED: uncharacterized protein LOC105952765 [Erythranthe guttata]XP_012831908.1 PREDICTED: uncharacterized protein LOC105952765 [Erythranthe guttata]EYU45904.1 hypothetical protein MIMGU_mgv1a000216mg [Erythranthe guttata]|eukprot:XP_012831833.1 PREDICTED: uncharacterized protein LOC105952765 [Erythranthe guttata]